MLEKHYKHMKYSDETLANILMKHLKTLEKHVLATCMYMQHLALLLQHPDKTLAISR
jgi:uncharacterized protein YejL (UPF0352 family)